MQKENFLKFYLQTTLGVFGTVLYVVFQTLMFISLFVPLLFLEVSSWWVHFGLILLLFTPLLGSILDVVLYCITFPTVIGEPTSFWTVAYFISFALFILTAVIPTIINLVIAIIDRCSRH